MASPCYFFSLGLPLTCTFAFYNYNKQKKMFFFFKELQQGPSEIPVRIHFIEIGSFYIRSRQTI